MGAEHSKHGGADPTQVAALHEHRRQQQQQQHHRLHPLHVPPQPAQLQHDELHLPRIQLTSPSPSTIQRHVTLRVLPLPTPPPPPLATPRTSGAPPAHKEATTATTATPPRPPPHDKVLLRCGAFRACGLTASPPAACLSASTHTHGSVASHTTSSTSTHATRPAKTPHTSRLPTSRSLTPVCTTCDTATARASDTQTRAHTHTRNDSRTHQHHDDKKTKKSNNNNNKSGSSNKSSSNKSSSNKSSRGSTSHGARSDVGAAGERSTQPPRPLPAVTMAAAAAERAVQSWHKAVDWVAVTEAALVMDWCARRLVRSSPAAAAAAMTTTSSISNSALVSAPATSAAAATQASAKRHEQATASGTATASAAATPTAAGADVQVPLNCDAVPFPYNRTTCVVYKPCNAAHDRNGGAALTAPCSSHVGAAAVGGVYANALPVELPVGEAYYNALCAAWRQPATGVAGNNSSGRGEAALALPPVADEDDLDDSLILESIEDAVSCEFSPAIPLQHMITLLVPEWEEEGLYEDLQ